MQALRLGHHVAAALEAACEGLAAQPDSLGLLHEQARCLALLGPPEAADAAWATALAAWPHDGALRLDHAEYLLRLSREEEALAALEPLVGPAAGFDRASLLLLRLLRHRLAPEALLVRFAAALAAGPPPRPDAVALEVALRGGLLLLGCGRLAEATALLEPARAASAAPPNLALRAGLQLLLARGEDAAARALAEQALATHRRQGWARRELLRPSRERAEADYAAGVFRRAGQLFHDRPGDWLRLAEAGQRGLPPAEILARLEALAPTSGAAPVALGAEEALRAARLAQRHGANALADRLLGQAAPPPGRLAAWQRHLALREVVARLPRPDGEEFTTTLLRPLGALAAAQPECADWAAGPIVLVHDGLGSGGAGRPITGTLAGLVVRLDGSRPLHLLCTRLTEHPERRLHLAAVRATGASVIDLSGQDAPPREASGLGAEAQDLVELLGLAWPPRSCCCTPPSAGCGRAWCIFGTTTAPWPAVRRAAGGGTEGAARHPCQPIPRPQPAGLARHGRLAPAGAGQQQRRRRRRGCRLARLAPPAGWATTAASRRRCAASCATGLRRRGSTTCDRQPGESSRI